MIMLTVLSLILLIAKITPILGKKKKKKIVFYVYVFLSCAVSRVLISLRKNVRIMNSCLQATKC